MWKCCRAVINFFKHKPSHKPSPRPVHTPSGPYIFDWKNEEWDRILIDEIRKSGLIKILPTLKDKEAFGYTPDIDPVIFYGRILVAMAKYESNYNPDAVYKESFGVYSRGLFQISLVDAKRYNAPFTTEESVNVPELNIIGAVRVFAKLVENDRYIGSRIGGRWKGGARYWSVLRGTRAYTKEALNYIKHANDIPMQLPSEMPQPINQNDLIDLKTTIVVGHNSKAQGAVNYKGETEYYWNTIVASKVADLLAKHNYHVNVKHRLAGVSYHKQVLDVVKSIKENNDNTMISLHFNSAGIEARGVEVLTPITASLEDDKLAGIIANNIGDLGITKRHDNGIYPISKHHNGADMLYSCNKNGITSVLVEPGFFDYENEQSRAIVEHIDIYAKLLCNSILEYKNLPEIE